MKKLLLTSITAICLFLLTTAVYAAIDPPTIQTTVSGTVGEVFSIAFCSGTDPDTHVPYVSYPGATGLAITNIDPTSNLNYLDNHDFTAAPNGKPDIGVICKSNEDTTWYLKTGVSGDLVGYLLYYLAQPTVEGDDTSGTLTDSTPEAGKGWPVIPNDTIYTSGDDNINTPFGTYCGMSIGVNGGGLAPGAKSGTVTFTLTQSM